MTGEIHAVYMSLPHSPLLAQSSQFCVICSPYKRIPNVIISPPSCRDEFNLKLALLSNQWQGVVRRAQQRRGIIDGLIRQWQRYREMVEKLRKWLVEVSHPAEALQAGTTVPLQQARSMLDAVQVHNVKAYRAHFFYASTVDAAGQNHFM